MRPWHWLVALVPSVEIGVVTLLAVPLGHLFFPQAEYSAISILILNLVVFAALCWAIGVWLTNPATSWIRRINRGVLCGVVLAGLNCGIAGAGCSLFIPR
jgi:hypothetical protein